MLTRDVVLLASMLVLLVEGGMDSNDAGIHAMSTESMNIISADQPDVSQNRGGRPSDSSSFSSEAADPPAVSQVMTPKAAVAAKSVEDDDEKDEDKRSNSEEVGKKKVASRSAKPRNPVLPPPSPAHDMRSPVNLPQSPALPPPPPPPQPIIPQPKVLLRNRATKRRSRTNRRHI